uniref:Protein LLP homolog n=1 Tax=Erpetoichthys calabaricus TaxID=27687 RepID=A0A8C4RF00_ERPCA
MAKSLRSKWRRKMRAEKRKKNAPKELTRLKGVLNVDVEGGILMKEIKEMATVVPPKKLQEKALDVEMEGEEEVGSTMETDGKRSKKTKLNEHGQYPVWMHPRQRRKLKQKRVKQGKTKKMKKRA